MRAMKSHALVIVLVLCLLSTFHVSSTAPQVPNLSGECYAREGDLNIAFFHPIRGVGDEHLCSETLFSASRVTHVEAFVFAIDAINKRTDLLPNVTLGFVILDSCKRDLTALARSLYLIPDDAATYKDRDIGSIETCQGDNRDMQFDVVGVVGPGSSRSALLVASLLSLLHIPTIGTFTTSDELSDKSRFEYFLRMVPPDRFQVDAILDFLKYYKWSYVSLLYSEGSYGENAGKRVMRNVPKIGYCLGYSSMVPSDVTTSAMEKIVRDMNQYKNARAVILFLEYNHLLTLFGVIDSKNLRGQFVWIGGDAMGHVPLGPEADGAFVIHLVGNVVPEIDQYVKRLTPVNNPNNPWMKDLWEMLYDCTWDRSRGSKSCYEFENIADSRRSGGTTVSNIADGALVYAEALHQLITQHCPEAFITKDNIRSCIDGTLLLHYLRNVSLDGYSGRISFNEKGDVLGRYDIKQLFFGPNPYSISVATWDKGKELLEVNNQVIDWTIFTENQTIPGVIEPHNKTMRNNRFVVESVCSHPCADREYYIQKEVDCCWDCRKCRENERLNVNLTACIPCQLFMWPREGDVTSCEPIEAYFLRWDEPASLGLAACAILGALACCLTAAVYISKRDAKIIKASSRELSAVTLIGVLLAFLTIFAFLARPNVYACASCRLGFDLAEAFIYAPLLVKTNRIYRIFKSGRKGKIAPKFIGNRAQLFFSLILILVQVVLSIVAIIFVPPEERLNMPIITEKHVELLCWLPLEGLLPPLCYSLFLILSCAIHGFVTRRLPENFNESWYIFASVATTSFLWLVFLPTYFTAASASHRAILLASCLAINALVTLVCLYLPKIYAIYFVDEGQLNITNTAGVANTGTTSTTVTDNVSTNDNY